MIKSIKTKMATFCRVLLAVTAAQSGRLRILEAVR